MIAEKRVALDWDVARYILPGTSDEPLVPANTCEYWLAQPIYHQIGLIDALPKIWVRRSVYERLLLAARALPPKYRLVLLDGWRPKSVQEFLFNTVRKRVASANPAMTEKEVEHRTLQFAARASNDPIRPSPHITGGAIDVTLSDQDGFILDMGGEFDEVSERSWTAALVPSPAAERRKHLLQAMQQAGFTNLPSEWWHFDYGNWVWAWYSKRPAALYGPAQAPLD